MFNWFKSFLQKSSTKESGGTLLGIAFVILLLRYLGLLQFPELAAYDLLFFLRPPEPKDERIVIVAWDEEQIQLTGEETMPDRTLSDLLEKIREQQPRYIGLDLFRDVRVTSPFLSDEENKQAYNELEAIFSSTPNLIGIEKVLPPIVKSSQLLKKQDKITAADLVSDSDSGRIRRGYLYPLEDKKGNPFGIPSLALNLGYRYLELEGFEAEKVEQNALRIFNPQTGAEITLEPLQPLDGSYVRDEEGLEILINWRTGNSPFTIVSASKVVEGLVSPAIFTDKIVLIGNTAVSSADKHQLPLNRWVKPQPQWTYGVEIHAHIASSIISAALDERPLIKTIPEWSEIGLIIFAVGLITSIAQKNRLLSPLKLFLLTTTGTLVIVFGLGVLAYVAFTEGYWIPIVPSVFGSIATPIVICLTIYISKIKAANEDFKRLLKDINHSLKNPLRSILDKAELAEHIALLLENERSEELNKLKQQFGQPPLTNLRKNLEGIVAQSRKIQYLRENAQKYFGVAYLGSEIFNKQPTDLNELAQETFSQAVALKQLEYNLSVEIQEDYDNTIGSVKLDPSAMERVLENLIDNAFAAMAVKAKKQPTYTSKIGIQTQKQNNQIKISITDNGIGIAEHIIDQIFEPFKSFKARGEGQGLGLSIVQETLRLHDGNIKVETEPGQGSKFIVTLPNR